MRMIFKSSHGRYPSIGALLQCDLFCDFRLREMRRDSISVRAFFKVRIFFLTNEVLFYIFFVVKQTKFKCSGIESVGSDSSKAKRSSFAHLM